MERGEQYVRGSVSILLLAALVQGPLADPANAHDSITESGDINVEITVHSYLILTIDDGSLAWTINNLNSQDHSTMDGASTPTARATFTVASNDSYYLEATVPGSKKWNPSNLLPAGQAHRIYARFDHVGSVEYIAGTIFLDDDVTVPQPTGDWTGITEWNFVEGAVSTGNYDAEERQWGLGAEFAVQYVGTANQPRGIVGGIAPAGTYATSVTVTAALSP
jgi:hypothetical protein